MRRSARELDVPATREELLRHVRWAAGLAVDGDQQRAKAVVNQLIALSRSDLLDVLGQLQVEAALTSVVLPPRDELRELEGGGMNREAVPLDVSITDQLRAADDVR